MSDDALLYIDACDSIKIDHIARINYVILKITNLETFTLTSISFSSPQSDSFLILNETKEYPKKSELDSGESLYIIAFTSNLKKSGQKNLRFIITFFGSEDQSSNFYIYQDSLMPVNLGTARQMIRDLNYYSIPYTMTEKMLTGLNQTPIDNIFISDSQDLFVITAEKEFLIYGDMNKLSELSLPVKYAYLSGRTISLIDDLFMIKSEDTNTEILRYLNKLNNYLEKLKVPKRISVNPRDNIFENKDIQADLIEIDKFIEYDYEKIENKNVNNGGNKSW